VFQVPARGNISADMMAGLSTDVFFDALAIRLDPAKAAGQSFVLNWRFTDRDETLTLCLRHCTLTHRMGDWSAAAAAAITTTRATLDALVLRKVTAQDALASEALEVEGDASRFAQLFGMLDQPSGLMFEVLRPGAGR
jgi:alkyl sulfatase BDS1-like metallo-beta-lactamase superfamily hydrolase